ncbi:two-component system sensor histidine kinase LytS [Natranaerovirga hydrolytica]|uniref:histidine kinase n=1 Tax=Natranaerovirga hydrolytica TaxID=680378 RepID=A0A4R1MJF2_9FIRM|nr:sensor histidine kinase [Natranaerovirga hydrolytica]TCK92617.1 two-component system sensor histidine kinase LytS [Natranaerovirga hydrolytica]
MSIIEILIGMFNRLGIIVVLAFIFSKTKVFIKLFDKKKIGLVHKIFMALFFGMFGIIGTYQGIEIHGALANSRVVGVFVGGLFGGPFIGILSGTITGFHRWAIDIGGFTAFACGVSTFLEGVMAGWLSRFFYKSKNKLVFAFIAGAIAEVLQMIIILILARPFEDALQLVQIIAFPMIVVNAIGIMIFIWVVQSIFKDQERVAALQAQRALQIANKTLQYFRKGFNEENAVQIAKIIYNMTPVKAVAITDKEKILAHIGTGDDHHLCGDQIRTGLTREAIEQDKIKIAHNREGIHCNYHKCKLKSAVIVPLKEKDVVIGTLKLYKTRENAITQVDLELALGLASLFSTQIELCKLDAQMELLAKAELKALQAQINPHFLFNAINTIVSFSRTKPDKARELLLHLGDFFRKNLQQNVEEVDLRKEIDHVQSYLEIERARFGEKLKVDFEIDQNVQCTLPPLILQPLVENAIKHGVMERLEGGNIKIRAFNKELMTHIIVEDNGVGIKKEQLNALLSNNPTSDSVGLQNVNQRLINIYGEKYGLEIKSQYDVGTQVIIKIPFKNEGRVVNV